MEGILFPVRVTVMAGKIKLSFHIRVLLTVTAICWILTGTFMTFQYQREKVFKAKLLDATLQMHNMRILEDIRNGEKPDEVVARIEAPVKDLRITLIDRDGNVVYDNNDNTPFPSSNHNSRPEIINARTKGEGYAVERFSESDDLNYFYSARLGNNGTVIRSAVPYSHTLSEFLRADISLIWIMAALTFAMSIIAFFATRKISLSIQRLNSFAAKAERGEKIYCGEYFPHDELGSIASHIVRLYAQRDEQHRAALRLQEDKTRLKKQLTNNINHELKTPVASILVCLDLIEDHPEIPETKKAEYIHRIRTNAQRLNSLLKDIAAITRMDEGSGMIGKADLHLTSLIMDIVEEERLKTDMTIKCDIPDLMIYGNRQMLESIFRNLIDNAIAYSGASLLTIEANSEGNFRVSDNGCGIPSEHLPHIFERFYRIDKGRSRAAGGTGLGLSIVRNAVAIHGGDIKANSLNGLSFDFKLAGTYINPAAQPKVNKNVT